MRKKKKITAKIEQAHDHVEMLVDKDVRLGPS